MAVSPSDVSCGSVKLLRGPGGRISLSRQTSLIPPIERIADISTSIDDDGAETRGIDWVLIVEKDVSLPL